MDKTPKSLRTHVGIYGRRNVGKSSIMNFLANQNISIVSNVAGTTTDPVEKAMEVDEVGALLLIDSAGLDDEGFLGEKRVEKSLKKIDQTDIAIIVVNGDIWGEFETRLEAIFKDKSTPFIVVCAKQDEVRSSDEFVKFLQTKSPHVLRLSVKNPDDKQSLIDVLKESILSLKQDDERLLDTIVKRGDVVVLVAPIDKESPKGRLILAQTQVLRDILDKNAISLTLKPDDLLYGLGLLKKPPNLIISDSQCIAEVIKLVPKNIKITTFSIIMAKFKGDLKELVLGARTVGTLKQNDKILIAQACTHHAVDDDIARVKIPKLLKSFTGVDLDISYTQGAQFPENLSQFKLIIHCGGCMINKKAMMHRIKTARDSGVFITNYGVIISMLQGVLDRSLQPFFLQA